MILLICSIIWGIIGLIMSIVFVADSDNTDDHNALECFLIFLCITAFGIPLLAAAGIHNIWMQFNKKSYKKEKALAVKIIDDMQKKIDELEREKEEDDNCIKRMAREYQDLNTAYKKLIHDDPIEKMRREIGLGIEPEEEKLTVRPAIKFTKKRKKKPVSTGSSSTF